MGEKFLECNSYVAFLLINEICIVPRFYPYAIFMYITCIDHAISLGANRETESESNYWLICMIFYCFVIENKCYIAKYLSSLSFNMNKAAWTEMQ